MWLSLYASNFVEGGVKDWQSVRSTLTMMRQAGLGRCRVTIKPMFCVAQVLEPSEVINYVVGVFNLVYYPGMVVICEGTKPNQAPSTK